MKTKRILIIATLLTFMIMGAANATSFQGANNNKTGQVIRLTLQEATKDLGLVGAIFSQVSIQDVLSSASNIYVAKVSYKDNVYLISGARSQWVFFFKMLEGVSSNTTNSIIKGR
jgi:hypothetical protein